MRQKILYETKLTQFFTYIYNHVSHLSYTSTYSYYSTYEDFFVPACQLHHKIFTKQNHHNLHNYTHAHNSPITVPLYIRQYFRTILSQFKDIFHQDISLSHRFNLNQNYSNINSIVLCPRTH